MGIQSLVVFLLLALAFPRIVNCNSEGDALHALRTAWNDPNNVLQSWDPTLVNPCTWFHVTCNGNNSVVRVDLGNAGLSGPLLPELGKLANLQYLELFENEFTGVIPVELGNLSNLVSLGLHRNRLSGPIPSSLGCIKTLKFLYLNGNLLSGVVPTKILDLVLTGSLIQMNVSDNRLSGRMRSPYPTVTTIIQDPKASS